MLVWTRHLDNYNMGLLFLCLVSILSPLFFIFLSPFGPSLSVTQTRTHTHTHTQTCSKDERRRVFPLLALQQVAQTNWQQQNAPRKQDSSLRHVSGVLSSNFIFIDHRLFSSISTEQQGGLLVPSSASSKWTISLCDGRGKPSLSNPSRFWDMNFVMESTRLRMGVVKKCGCRQHEYCPGKNRFVFLLLFLALYIKVYINCHITA